MKRTAVVLILTLLAVATVALAAQQPPEEVVIDAAADKQSAVTFPHADHLERVDDCTTCHHTAEGLTLESDVKVETCSACHLDPEEGVPGMREMSLKKNPFHMVCVDCHKTEEKGPTKCFDCHPKE